MVRFVHSPEPCAYLPQRLARFEHEVTYDVTPEVYERMMDEGWRKFGSVLFRPVCPRCAECRPIRVPVAEFSPSRSQSRTLNKNRDLVVVVGQPSADEPRIELFRRYHAAQAVRKGWPTSSIEAWEYVHHFLTGSIPMLEVAIYDREALRSICLLDVTPSTYSAVYHFYDVTLPERGLGTFTLLNVLRLAKDAKKQYLYLGYLVEESASMRYKAGYRPCEVLGVDGVWRKVEGSLPPVRPSSEVAPTPAQGDALVAIGRGRGR